MKNPLVVMPSMDLPLEYTVVGEHRFDPTRLLLHGVDDRYYELRLDDGQVVEVDPGPEWVADVAARATPVSAA